METEYTKHLKIQDKGLTEEGFYRTEEELEAIHLSRVNLVHGGMVFSMLDATMGRAVFEQLPKTHGAPTIEMKINYFRPQQSGKLICEGKVINKSKQLCYAEGEVRNEEGKLIAKATGTFFIKPMPRDF